MDRNRYEVPQMREFRAGGNNSRNQQPRDLDGNDQGRWNNRGGPANRGGHHNIRGNNRNARGNFHGEPRGNRNYNQYANRNDGNRNENSNNNNNGKRFERDEDENSNHPRKQHGNRPERKLGYRYLVNLIETDDVEKVILDLSNDKSGFGTLLERSDIKEDMVVLVVNLIWKICHSTFQQNKISILNSVLQSRFMEKLTVYITNILLHGEKEKRYNRHLWDDTDKFWNNLLDICKKVQELIPSQCETVLNLVNTLGIYLPLIEEKHSIHISDQIKVRSAELLDIIRKTISDLEIKKASKCRVVPMDEDDEPPDDFREIPIIPSAAEVLVSTSPFLRKNIIDRAFKNVEQYLDIQFRLLREDFVAPLRKGINTYLANLSIPKAEQEKVDDIKIYKPVIFLSVETINECNCYKLRFDFGRKKRTFRNENSKRFMFGSLVCFTCDDFGTLLFGKIVNRDIKDLEQGLLTVGFQENVDINFEADYLMIESSVYFEPYYHVLNVLKNMKTENFPMEKYIINVETTLNPPRYLERQQPVVYNIQGLSVPVLTMHLMQHQQFYNLNDSQLRAFKAAMTDEFSIIQGPPGTGKTFLGLKIAHTLLQNQSVWYNHTPMLVICYTNHALDQFLEGLLPVTKNIVRVGSQSKNEELQKYNIMNRRKESSRRQPVAVFQKKREVIHLINQQKSLNETLKRIDANDCVLSFNVFRNVIEGYGSSWFGKARNEDIKNWLMQGKTGERLEVVRQRTAQREARQQIENLNLGRTHEETEDIIMNDEDKMEDDWLDDVFGGTVAISAAPIITKQQLTEKLDLLRKSLLELETNSLEDLNTILQREKLEREIWESESELDYLTIQLNNHENPRNRLRPRHIDMLNPSTMQYEDRWKLYYYWLGQYALHLRQQYREFGKQFREVYQIYNEMREIEDYQLMREHFVVGMTTTGAARLQSTLQALKSPIVIVEEAAEVLEAHIVAALTDRCQHLILIGDHLQLKPGAATYEIETKFQLGISLFERMVRNNIKCHTLNVQHRMRPEISQLIKPHIYPELLDHETTLHRAPIKGIETPLYFINHQEREEQCQDASKKNIHESRYLIALARHLVLNGYKPEQVTILAAYLGQSFEMCREKNKPTNRMILQDVRISVLDNYQGEESDIILLSLVRSNENDVAGFLRIQNRVCVALSRARDGFYIMGNMSLLLKCQSENGIWDEVNEVLKRQNAIGTHLALRCQIHRHKITQVSKAEDFEKLSEGGCDLLCEAPLACGHVCKSLCHIRDRDHALYTCTEKCTRVLCNDPKHVCPKRCFEDCGQCNYIVRRHLDECGHDVDIECHIDVDQYKCSIKVSTALPCGHTTKKPCYADPDTFKCPYPCDRRVEPCGHMCDRKCHVRVDPDHLQYYCRQPCAKPKVGCLQDGDKHICTQLCYQDCEECNVIVKKVRSCTHIFTKVACKLDVETMQCEKPCKLILACGHPCSGKCFEECKPCTKPVVKVIPECSHNIRIECYETPQRAHCKSKLCPRILPCGHGCKAACKNPCTARCTELVDCNISTPCGHIMKKIMCYLKNNATSEDLLKYCSHPCGAELKCGHTCTGTCGECMQYRIHKRCNEKCGVPLVCNHECPIPCRESCKPCTRPCEMRCKHSKCKKKCGEPCTPCRNPCSRQCQHVSCKKSCGEICDVGPCKERCQKKNGKCGHRCVGFCGDPCPPLCRLCNKEELTEIFFGTEEDDGATFVYLNDCKHVLEHSGLEAWLNEGENKIEFKVCPKCKTTITTTERYSDYVKRALADVVLAKTKSFGVPAENEIERTRLAQELVDLTTKCSRLPLKVHSILSLVFTTLQDRLKPTKNNRIQAINKIELNAIRSKVQTLKYVINCFDNTKIRILTDDDLLAQYLKIFRDALMRSDDHVTNQEIEDLQLEIKRLRRVVQLHDMKSSMNFLYAITRPDVKLLKENVERYLLGNSRYSDNNDVYVKGQLESLGREIGAVITDQERIEIVKAIGLSKGHWFKCPNGHPYAIGECGGAMQIARCFCGAQIGGTNHHLLEDNRFAGEMDGAPRHAWPGGLH